MLNAVGWWHRFNDKSPDHKNVFVFFQGQWSVVCIFEAALPCVVNFSREVSVATLTASGLLDILLVIVWMVEHFFRWRGSSNGEVEAFRIGVVFLALLKWQQGTSPEASGWI